MPYILVQCLCVMCPWLPSVVTKVLSAVELIVGREREFYFIIENGWMRLC